MLRFAFNLAARQRRLSRTPIIEMLAEPSARDEFVEPSQFEKLVAELPDYLQDPSRFDYIIGWRKKAVRNLRWADVDRENRRIYLRSAISKNAKPYVMVLTDELAAIIDRRWQARLITRQDGTTHLCEWVFHRDGSQIGDFRKAWAAACVAANFCRPKTDEHGNAVFDRSGRRVMEPTLRFHDFRRSAARNLDRAGVSQAAAMKVTGHATDSMWRRYRIVDESDIERALTAAQVYIGEQVAKTSQSKVVSLCEARR